MKKLRTGFVVAALTLTPMQILAEDGFTIKELTPEDHSYHEECPEPGKLSEVSFSVDKSRGQVIEINALNTLTFYDAPTTTVTVRKDGYVVREEHPTDDLSKTAVISASVSILLCNQSTDLSVLAGKIEISGENDQYRFEQKYYSNEDSEVEDARINLSITQTVFPEKIKLRVKAIAPRYP